MFRTPKNPATEGAIDPNDEMLVIVDRSVNPYLFLYHEPAGFRAEQVRSVRNKLVALNPDGEPKTLAIASAMRGEGKTSTAINLAMALAELERTEVVLVDADMRRPGIATFLNLEETMGLSDVLQGKTSVERVIHPAGFRNLAVVTAGTRVPNPAEILGASRLEQLLSRLKESYDYVVIDTPPVLACTDASVVAARADGTVFVVRMEKSNKALVRQSLRGLKETGANVLGTFATELRGADPEADERLSYDFESED